MAVEKRPLPKKVFVGTFYHMRSGERINVGNETIEKNSLGHKILDEFLMIQNPFFSFTVQDIVDQLETNGENRMITYVCVYRYVKMFEDYFNGKIQSRIIGKSGRGKRKEYWLTKPIIFFITDFDEEEN